MLAAKALTLDEFTRGFAFRYWRERVCHKTQEEMAADSEAPSLATIQRIELDKPKVEPKSFVRYAAAMGTTLAEIDALLERLNSAAKTGGGTLRAAEIGATRGLPSNREIPDPVLGESRNKESPTMHSRHIRLLEVELDYMTDEQAAALLERLHTMREHSGRSSPGRAQSRSAKKR